jgi:hypothetical protein
MRHLGGFVSLGLLLALLWPTRPASAQALYGSVAGTVTDSSGAAVPEARLTITSRERRTVDTAISNASGFYLRDRLLPGAYAVEAARAGFKEVHVPSVMVYVDTQTRVDLELYPGPVTETVTVEAQGQLLKTDRADVATTLGAQEITDLPNLDRNFTKFLLLSPGANQVPWQHASSENPQGSIQIMVNGQHFGGTGYQLDGTENRDPILGIIVINPNLEAIAEAKVTSQNYDAEFGQATAGVVSVRSPGPTSSMAAPSSSTGATGFRPATRSRSPRANPSPTRRGTGSEAPSEGPSGRTASSSS